MGKASSSKKVQRAARAGSTSAVNRPKLGFPAAIVAIVVAGVALIAFARSGLDSTDVAPRLNPGGDHWHTAYGIYTCDGFEAPLVDVGGDAEGIHTHGDGLMHIHPFSSNASGDNARLDRWVEQVGLSFGDDSLTLPSGETFTNGDDCGGTPGEVVVARWDDARTVAEADPDVVLRTDFSSLAYVQDGSAMLIAFVAEGADLPKPDVSGLAEISDLAPGEEGPFEPGELPPGTTVPGGPTTTGAGGPTTTVAGGPTTTAGDAPATTVPSTTAP